MSEIIWDICNHLHAMSDMGFSDKPGQTYSRPHTNNAECYAFGDRKGEKCNRNGRCIIARHNNCKIVNKKSW